MSRPAFGTAARVGLALAALSALGACRSWRPEPPGQPVGQPRPAETTRVPAERTNRDSVPPAIAAILDSIETAVRDSIEAVRRESLASAARRDSLAAARRDSLEAARRDSLAAAARRDSLEAARRNSVEAARRDSLAAAARRDSIAAAARRDSLEAVRRDSLAAAARRDSVEAALRDSLAAVVRRDALEAARVDSVLRSREEIVTDDLDQLRSLGPSYMPYDRGPRPVWDTEMQAKVRTALLPVIRDEDLEARTRAFFWLLIRADGTVDQVVLQTSSGNRAFDTAAARFARELLFAPAIRGDRAVPTWVIRNISLIMQ